MEALLEANQMDHGGGKAKRIDRFPARPPGPQPGAHPRYGGDGMRDVCRLPDPVGEIDYDTTRPNGLHIQRVRVPIGVIGIIYEARPNVTADAAGSVPQERATRSSCGAARRPSPSNRALSPACHARPRRRRHGLPEDCSRTWCRIPPAIRRTELMRCNGYLDVLIPARRRRADSRCGRNTQPCRSLKPGWATAISMSTRAADLDMAVDIVVNAKTPRPSVCNAMRDACWSTGRWPEPLSARWSERCWRRTMCEHPRLRTYPRHPGRSA